MRPHERRWQVVGSGVFALAGAVLLAATFVTDAHEAAATAQPGETSELAAVTRDLNPRDQSVAVDAMASWDAQASAQTVFAPDERIPVVDTAAAPWRSVVHLVIFDAYGHVDSDCTGSMVNYNVVLTAAHCVAEGGVYVDSVMVIPGDDRGHF